MKDAWPEVQELAERLLAEGTVVALQTEQLVPVTTAPAKQEAAA